MLTLEAKNKILEHLKTLTFSYDGTEFDVEVIRSQQEFNLDMPQIFVKFISSPEKRQQVLGDIIGSATPGGTYMEYGFQQNTLIRIRCMAKNMIKDDKSMPGTYLVETMVQTIYEDILQNWKALLYETDCTYDRTSTPSFTNQSTFYTKQGTQIHIYELSVMVARIVHWNNIPEEDFSEELIESIGLAYKSDKESDYTFKIIKED